jgi:hypothetical protein
MLLFVSVIRVLLESVLGVVYGRESRKTDTRPVSLRVGARE